MRPGSKCTFTTGKVLEDTIFHNVRPTPANSKWLQGNPILRWILDLDDLEVKKWFTRAEKIELSLMGAPLPPRDPAFEYSVNRFPKVLHHIHPFSLQYLLRFTDSRLLRRAFGYY